jgi:hypothetical protein
MEWMPIDTAPKDGTLLLICSGNYYERDFPVGVPTTASWRAYHPNAKGKECWRDINGNKLSPTHWMHLPPDPSGSKREKELR